MARPLKDTETNRPAVSVGIKLTEPRLEWLKALAERRNTSLSGAIELLIDRARGMDDEGTIRPATAIPDAPGYQFPTSPLVRKVVAAGRDPKDGVAPIPKKTKGEK